MRGAGRFNERLVLSLAGNVNCMLLDDELNILPTSTLTQHIRPVPLKADGSPDVPDPSREAREELQQLKQSLADTQVGATQEGGKGNE
jgi:N-acetyltransferase 10